MKSGAGACYASLSAAEAAGWKVSPDVIVISTVSGRFTTSSISVFRFMPWHTNGVLDQRSFGWNKAPHLGQTSVEFLRTFELICSVTALHSGQVTLVFWLERNFNPSKNDIRAYLWGREPHSTIEAVG